MLLNYELHLEALLMAKIKCHHPHPVKAGSWNYGKVAGQLSPWVKRTVYDTVVETADTELVAKVFARIRQKHTECLAVFHPNDFLRDVKLFLHYLHIHDRGRVVCNHPSSTLPDQEAWLF